jgi:uncharacterized protein DUF3313
MNTSARMIVQVPALALAVMLFGAPALAQRDREGFPEQTEEGLVRQESKRLDVVYWRPGATLANYKRIGLIDVEVQFVKDWAEDQNRSRPGVDRVTAEDMDRIRMGLVEEFRKVFTKELEEEGGYEIVDVVGDDVLILRPAIVNLDVNAPDINQPSRTRSYVASAGQMTLYMDLYDAGTRSLIGRAIDRRDAAENAYYQVANSVTNKAEADRIIRAWATTLREALDEQWSGNPRKSD